MPASKKKTNHKKSPAARKGGTADKGLTEPYRHPTAESLMRPEVGTQAQFRKKKPPVSYRYDSSLSPVLEWDGQNSAREQGEALIAKLYDVSASLTELQAKIETAKLEKERTKIQAEIDKARVAFSSIADGLKALGKPFLNWAGKAERLSFNVPTLPLFVHERLSHLNYIVADTRIWEQSAAYYIDTHPVTGAFVKNQGLGFALPYFHNGQNHDYFPDFIIRLDTEGGASYLILETKGFDELESIKKAAAERWINAVNVDQKYGYWQYAVAKKPEEVRKCLDKARKR